MLPTAMAGEIGIRAAAAVVVVVVVETTIPDLVDVIHHVRMTEVTIDDDDTHARVVRFNPVSAIIVHDPEHHRPNPVAIVHHHATARHSRHRTLSIDMEAATIDRLEHDELDGMSVLGNLYTGLINSTSSLFLFYSLSSLFTL